MIRVYVATKGVSVIIKIILHRGYGHQSMFACWLYIRSLVHYSPIPYLKSHLIYTPHLFIRLSQGRVRKIIKMDPDVKGLSKESVIAATKATVSKEGAVYGLSFQFILFAT
jgi:hypothetical protein